MLYEVRLNARGLHIRVQVDGDVFPSKTQGPRAREALGALVKGISAAIEAAPHVGVARESVAVGPIMTSGDSAGPAPTKPQAPRVGGGRTLDALKAAVKAAILPPKVRLATEKTEDRQVDLVIRHGADGTAIAFLQEDRPETWPYPLDSISVKLPHDFEFEDVRKHVTEAALKLAERIEEAQLTRPRELPPIGSEKVRAMEAFLGSLELPEGVAFAHRDESVLAVPSGFPDGKALVFLVEDRIPDPQEPQELLQHTVEIGLDDPQAAADAITEAAEELGAKILAARSAGEGEHQPEEPSSDE